MTEQRLHEVMSTQRRLARSVLRAGTRQVTATLEAFHQKPSKYQAHAYQLLAYRLERMSAIDAPAAITRGNVE